MKEFKQMSAQELAALFPIVLAPHRECWREWYAGESGRLLALLSAGSVYRLSHIGSTAVKGIWAKPTVDMLLETEDGVAPEALVPALVEGGYILMCSEGERVSLNRGYTPRGFARRVFHLHLRRRGDNDELYFRDLLNARADLAAEYERLKLSLWKPYEHDRDGYTRAKGDFVRRHTAQARQMYANRYS